MLRIQQPGRTSSYCCRLPWCASPCCRSNLASRDLHPCLGSTGNTLPGSRTLRRNGCTRPMLQTWWRTLAVLYTSSFQKKKHTVTQNNCSWGRRQLPHGQESPSSRPSDHRRQRSCRRLYREPPLPALANAWPWWGLLQLPPCEERSLLYMRKNTFYGTIKSRSWDTTTISKAFEICSP